MALMFLPYETTWNGLQLFSNIISRSYPQLELSWCTVPPPVFQFSCLLDLKSGQSTINRPNLMFLFGLGWLLPQTVSAHELSGTVIHNGTGLNNAAIYLFDVNQQYMESRSDANGNFTFTNVPTGLFRLFAVPDIDSNAIPSFFPNTPLYCDAEPIDISTDRSIDLNLETGTEVQTTLVINDTPVEGALLKLTPDGAWTRGGFSDENGTVWVGGLPDGALLTVEVEGDTIPTQWIMDTENSSLTFGYDEREAIWIEQSAIHDAELTINPGITIGGLVHSGPTPIPNANLSVYSNSQIEIPKAMKMVSISLKVYHQVRHSLG